MKNAVITVPAYFNDSQRQVSQGCILTEIPNGATWSIFLFVSQELIFTPFKNLIETEIGFEIFVLPHCE